MTSPRRIEANRINAARSTGPRSPAGKARSARNATRHGLATPAEADPACEARIAALTDLLAGSGPTPAVRAAARELAIAQAEVERARRARADLEGRLLPARAEQDAVAAAPSPRPHAVSGALAQAMAGLTSLDPGVMARGGRAARAAWGSSRRNIGEWRAWAREAEARQEEHRREVRQAAAAWLSLLRELPRLDRYEQRALARRARALRTLDAARAAASSTAPGEPAT